jgi:L-iditol 2-dehydrogenase
MQAFVKRERTFGAVELMGIEEPQPGPGQVKIQIKATALCGSDLHAYEYPKGYEFMQVPVVLGHEYSGFVAAVGEGVTRFKVGDRVMGESNQYCGYCANCLQSRTNICENNRMTGLHVNGGIAEYICIPERIVHRLPDNVSFAEAAVAQPCAVSFHAVFDKSGIKPADLVVVFGPGIVGLMAAQGAKIMGARQIVVVGTEVDEQFRAPIARQLGFFVINGQRGDLKQELLKVAGTSAADVVLECSGAAPALQSALELVRKGGSITLVGIYSKPVDVFFTPLIRAEIDLHMSYTCTWKNYEQALQLISNGQVDLRPVMKTYPFVEGLQAFQDGISKKVLKPVMIL